MGDADTRLVSMLDSIPYARFLGIKAELAGDEMTAILPFAQHKGWALSMMCEIVGGALSGGGVQDGHAIHVGTLRAVVRMGERDSAGEHRRGNQCYSKFHCILRDR